jgi:hypothetical protein
MGAMRYREMVNDLKDIKRRCSDLRGPSMRSSSSSFLRNSSLYG